MTNKWKDPELVSGYKQGSDNLAWDTCRVVIEQRNRALDLLKDWLSEWDSSEAGFCPASDTRIMLADLKAVNASKDRIRKVKEGANYQCFEMSKAINQLLKDMEELRDEKRRT
jgi:hypothetical protein